MAEPVKVGEIIREIMNFLERRRNLEKQFASTAKGQRGGLSPFLAGIQAEIGGKYGQSTN